MRSHDSIMSRKELQMKMHFRANRQLHTVCDFKLYYWINVTSQYQIWKKKTCVISIIWFLHWQKNPTYIHVHYTHIWLVTCYGCDSKAVSWDLGAWVICVSSLSPSLQRVHTSQCDGWLRFWGEARLRLHHLALCSALLRPVILNRCKMFTFQKRFSVLPGVFFLAYRCRKVIHAKTVYSALLFYMDRSGNTAAIILILGEKTH